MEETPNMKITRRLLFVLLAILLAGFLVPPSHAVQLSQCAVQQPPEAPNQPVLPPCIYVTDSTNNRVLVFSTQTGNFLFQFGSTGTGSGQFKTPIGIAVAFDGTVLVADSANSRIQAFDPDGHFIRQFGNSGTGPGRLITPTGVAVTALPQAIAAAQTKIAVSPFNIYVTDFANNRVVVFDSTGHFVFAFGSTGTGSGQFKGPWGINAGPVFGGIPGSPTGSLDGVAATGALFVTDQNNSRVQMFDTDGNFLGKFGASGTGPGNLLMPTGISTVLDLEDDCGDCETAPIILPPMLVMVADGANNRVNVYQAEFDFSLNRWTFQYLYKFGSLGTGPGQLSSPLGMFGLSLSSGFPVAVFGTDGNNHRVELFLALPDSASFATKLGTFGTGPGQFVTPAGVAMAPTLVVTLLN